MNIIVIPARSGSKRIPNKNVKPLLNKPAISYAIELAKRVDLFDHIFVSTDSEEIAELSINLGAEVPFLRPETLSDDYATTLQVMGFTVESLLSTIPKFDFACCLYPVTPLLEARRVREGFDLISTKELDYVFAVAENNFNPSRSFQLNEQNQVVKFREKDEFTRTQDLAPFFNDAGQFYWGRTEAWKKQSNILGGKSAVIRLRKWEVVDVDSQEDWELAEMLLSYRLQKQTEKK